MSMSEYNNPVIEEFRANRGVVGGRWTGFPLLLLRTVGAKSGEPRTTPLAYCTVDGTMVVIASFNGSPNHPSWYHNLMSNPGVTIEAGLESFAVRAITLEGEAWDRAHAEFVSRNPEIADHHARTPRRIPYVAFERIA